MPDVEARLTVENVVVSADTGRSIPTGDLGQELGVCYDPDRMPLVYRPRCDDAKGAVMIEGSGSLLATGGKSPAEARRIVRATCTRLREAGVDVPDDPAVTVENVVCAVELGREFDLPVPAIRLGYESCEYDPDNFPGLVYRPPQHEAVLLLFESGRLLITRVTSRADAVTVAETTATRLEGLGTPT